MNLRNIYKRKRPDFSFPEQFHGSIYFWFGGFIAFLWVLLRSGTRPYRLSYPCQQAAFPLASSWILAMAAFFGGTLLMKWLTRISAIAIVLMAAGFFSASFTESSTAADSLPVWKVGNPISNLFVLDNIPLTPGSLSAGNASVPDIYLVDPAIDTLLQVMESSGTHFYHTAAQSGMVRADHVIVIKANFQWPENLGTNTDRIKGLVWKILQHPDGFSGEILVCDNDQGERDFNECNNSEDTDQSIVDVVNTFSAKGYPVYLMAWDEFMSSVVNEYSDGDMSDGFPYNVSSKVTYPKFRSPAGTYISLRYGIWNTGSSSYDPSRLFIVDFPVVKAHALADATLAIKNWVGVMTTAYTTQRYGGVNSMHSDYIYGSQLLTTKIMEQTFPDLVIIDGTWTAPIDNHIPSSANRTRTDMLVASTDPVASSWYAAKYILTPVAHYPNWTNPDGSTGYGPIFRGWSDYLTNAGFNLTYDPSEMSVFSRESLESIKVTSITLQGAGGSTSIAIDNGSLQMSASVLPAEATNNSLTWSVINGTGQASISQSGLLQAIANGTVTVLATANDGSGVQGTLVITITNQLILVSSIALNGEAGATSIDLKDGTLQIYATVSPADATNKTVSWGVINGPGQATITSSGLLQAVSNGTVTVVATANDGSGKQNGMQINITNQDVLVTSISLSGQGGATTIEVDKGSLQINASVNPADADDKSVTWTVINGTGEASISASGLLRAVANGSVTVVATANDGSGVQGSLEIAISNQAVPVSSITLSGEGGATSINQDNGTLQINASVLPADADNKTVTWTVIDGTGEASISTGGLLQAVSNGTVTVIATANDGSGIQGSLAISITNQTVLVSSITLSGQGGATSINLDKGTLQIVANVLPSDASDKTLTWTVINGSGYATISATGLLQADSSGTVTVVASARDGSGVQGSLAINITNQTILVSSITLWGEAASAVIHGLGATLQIYAAVLPSYASDKSITWSVTNGTGQANITSGGLLTSVAAGMVTVVASANDGSGIQETMGVTISNELIPVTSIQVQGAAGSTSIGTDNGTLQMTASILPANATIQTVSWSVNKGTGEANITAGGLLQAISNGTVTVVATANDGSGVLGSLGINISNQIVLVNAINLAGEGGATAISQENGTLQIIATALPANANNKSVSWNVLNGTGQGTISGSGLLQAVSDGTVTVVATAIDGSGVQGSLQISIQGQTIPVTTITLSGEAGSTTIDQPGGSLQINAQVMPVNATNKTLVWSVINSSGQATISTGGLLQAIATGTVTVVATASDGSGTQGSLQVVITDQAVPVSSITLSGEAGSTIIDQEGGTLQIIAAVLPANASDKSLSWNLINNSGKASISSVGLLQAISDGNVTVVVTANDGSGVQNTLQVSISNQHIGVASISLAGEGGSSIIDLDRGTLQIYATVLPANATNKTLTWQVVNGTGQATINSAGLLQAVLNGSVTVLAGANDGSGVQSGMQVIISNQVKRVSSIAVTAEGERTTIDQDGGTLQIYASVLPVDADNKTVSWTVIDGTGRASISSGGLLQAIVSGTVTVVATAQDISGVQGMMDIAIANQIVKVSSIVLSGEGGSTSTDSQSGKLQIFTTVIPVEAFNKSISWSLENETGLATISSSGLVQGLAEGLITVYATANDGSGTMGSLGVTVNYNQVMVGSVIVEGEGGNTAIGEYRGLLQMVAHILPENATNQNILWTVNQLTGEAYIDQNGVLRAVSDGIVRVKACADDPDKVEGSILLYVSGQGTSNIEQEEITNVEILMDPNHEKLNIRWTDPSDEMSTIKIFNLYGQLVYLAEATSNSLQIDLSFLGSGYYIVQVNVLNKKLAAGKIFVF